MAACMVSVLLAIVLVYNVPSTSSQYSCSRFTRILNANLMGSTLHSPGYPLSNYPPNTNCSWLISAPFGYVVKLSFNTSAGFTLEFNFWTTCLTTSDYLKISDGSSSSSTTLGMYCGSSLPPDVYSSSRYMYLYFKTDWIIQKKGFQLTYKAVRPTRNANICSPFNNKSTNTNIKVQYKSSGYVQSPLNPSKYPSNMECKWVITVSSGYKIKLTFSQFYLESNIFISNCTTLGEYVEVRDGSSDWSSVLTTACGSYKPTTIYSSDRYMWIKFKSNSNNEAYSGFKARWEQTDPNTASPVGLIVGILFGVGILIAIIVCVVCVTKRGGVRGWVTRQTAPTVQTSSTYHAPPPGPPLVQYPPPQMQGGYGLPPAGAYAPPPAGAYAPPPAGAYVLPPAGAYAPPPAGAYAPPPAGAYAPAPPMPMNPYPTNVPPQYPGTQPGGSPYPPQVPGMQSSPPYPQGQTPQQLNPPFSPPQGAEIQQAAPPYPPPGYSGQGFAPTSDVKQPPSAPPTA